jgi:hypothetical protein
MLTKAHVAEFVRQYAIELAKLARSVHWAKLAELLDLVALEADREVLPARRNRPKKRN